MKRVELNVEDGDDSENDSVEKRQDEEEIVLAVSPRFNWKDLDQVSKSGATIK